MVSSGVATPGHTRNFGHVKSTGAQVKIMWKAKVVISMCNHFHVDMK